MCKAKAQRKRSKSNEKSRSNNAQMPTKVTWPGECTKSEILKNRFLKQKILEFFLIKKKHGESRHARDTPSCHVLKQC